MQEVFEKIKQKLEEENKRSLNEMYRLHGNNYETVLLKKHNDSICEIVDQVAEEYKQTEEQGLLLRLPCKVGSTVWCERQYKGLQPYQITNIMISQNKKGVWTRKYRAMRIHNGKTVDDQLNFSFDNIGKTVFLTKEEAEEALKKMRENSDE